MHHLAGPSHRVADLRLRDHLGSRLAHDLEAGEHALGQPLHHESIIGTVFEGEKPHIAHDEELSARASAAPVLPEPVKHQPAAPPEAAPPEEVLDDRAFRGGGSYLDKVRDFLDTPAPQRLSRLHFNGVGRNATAPRCRGAAPAGGLSSVNGRGCVRGLAS